MRTQRFISPVVLVLLALAVGADAGPVADTFARVKDSVVVIDFVERTPSLEVHGVSDRVLGSGSGVYIGDRRVLTAAHVVQVADEIDVEFTSGQILGARVLASVPAVDIALLELDAEPEAATVAQLGDPSRTAIGDRVLVVGAPRGISHTLTVGYLSGRRAGDVLFGDMVPSELLQTDAAINPGNSGGPMFDLDGKVIGIVSSILTVSGGSEGLGFAVSVNTIRSLLLEQRSTWTGIDAIFVEGEIADALNIPQGAGVLVQRVAAGSPAEAIGLRGGTMIASIGDSLLLLGGDVILSLHGVALTEPRRFLGVRAALLNLEPGETVQLSVLRGGQVLELAWLVP
jgi:S1-C subfamily serine protease